MAEQSASELPFFSAPDPKPLRGLSTTELNGMVAGLSQLLRDLEAEYAARAESDEEWDHGYLAGIDFAKTRLAAILGAPVL